MPVKPVGRDWIEHVFTASERKCGACGTNLQITQRRGRHVEKLDGLHFLVMRDKRCPDRDCPGHERIHRPPEELTFALKKDVVGLDVLVEVGERRLRDHRSFPEIHASLSERGVDLGERTVSDVYLRFLALVNCREGDTPELRRTLRANGGMILLVDGVQFDEHSPVLYVVSDALSHETLFAERHDVRSAKVLESLLERVKAMNVQVLAIVSDKEKGLVPAIHAVFPDVPHQFCQLHFLKRCAQPLDKSLTRLGEEVGHCAEKLRSLRRKLDQGQLKPEPSPAERAVAGEFLLAAHAASKVSGRAPFEPTALKRHERLLGVAEAVGVATQKTAPGRSSKRSLRS